MIKSVRPKYPKWARLQLLQGNVEITALIGFDRNLQNVTFLRGPKELAPYALKAVRQWRYEPQKLNGTPIETKTTIVVPFTLDQ